jgi:hypothetical protein
MWEGTHAEENVEILKMGHIEHQVNERKRLLTSIDLGSVLIAVA